jgi:nucleoid-associated protein YgaU
MPVRSFRPVHALYPAQQEVLMSAATEYAPAVYIPAPARPPAEFEVTPRLASVTVLHAPRNPATGAAPLRLTRRGVVVLAALVTALAGTLVWLAAHTAAAPAAAPPAPASVTVQAGDTLWSIAGRVAPQRDSRAEVAALQRANHLSGVDLLPGQVLRVP